MQLSQLYNKTIKDEEDLSNSDKKFVLLVYRLTTPYGLCLIPMLTKITSGFVLPFNTVNSKNIIKNKFVTAKQETLSTRYLM